MGITAAWEKDSGILDEGAGGGDGEREQMGEMVKRQNPEGYWWWIGCKWVRDRGEDQE